MVLEPPLVNLSGECAHQAEAAGRIWEDAHDPSATFDLFIEVLEHVGRLQMLVVLTRQAVEVQRLADVRFDPVGELRVPLLPARESRLEVLLCLCEIVPVIEPPELLPAIVIGLPGQIVEGVTEEVDVAALPHGLGQQLAHRALEPGVIVRHHKLDAVEAARLQPFHERRPARARLAVRQLDAEHLPPAFPVDPERNEHRLGLDHSVEADLRVARIQDHVGIGLLEPALRKATEQGIQNSC